LRIVSGTSPLHAVAIRLLCSSAIDGDAEDVIQARERLDVHLRATGRAVRGGAS
jgi:hypothetical protein